MKTHSYDYLKKSELIELLKERDQALSDSISQRDQYSALYEDSPLGYITLDEDGNIISTNKIGLSFFDLPVEDITGKPFIDFILEADREIFNGAFTHLKSQKPSPCEVGIGQNRFMMSGQVWEIENQQRQYVFNLSNITELRQTEAALVDSQTRLRINEERIRKILDHSPITLFNNDHFLRYTWIYNPLAGLPAQDFIGKTDTDIFGQASGDIFVVLKQQVLETGEALRQEVPFEWDNKIYYFDLMIEPSVDDEDSIVGVTCVALDITETKRIQQSEATQRTLADALQKTVVAVNSSLHLSEVLDFVLMNVGTVVPHDLADILLIDELNVALARTRGYSVNRINQPVLALGNTLQETPILVQMQQTHNPVVIPNISANELHANLLNIAWIDSYIGVPILWQDKVVGFLNLYRSDTPPFTEDDATRLVAFAVQAGVAIRNAQIFEEAQAMATFEERQRLARDLHDAVSQILFTSNIIAESLQRLWNKKPEQIPSNLEKLQRLNQGALAEMRALLAELRPQVIEKTPLNQLLEQLANAAEGRTQIQVLVEADAIVLPAEAQLVFYRVAQEALNNIIKHAEADFVKIIFRQIRIYHELIIEDDGRGFVLSATNGNNLGINIMQERVHNISGELTINTEVDVGTIIEVRWARPDEQSHAE